MKRINTLLLKSVLLASLTFSQVPTYCLMAQENNELYYEVDEKTIAKDEKAQIDYITQKLNSTRADEYVYDWRVAGSQTSGYIDAGYAGGQPTNGTIFSSPGGFIWSDGGYETNISVSISYGVFGVSVSRGYVNGTSTYVSSPYTGVPVKLKVARSVKVTQYNVYRKNKYGGSWVYDSTQYTTSVVGRQLTVVRV